MKKITLKLAPNKTVELIGFHVTAENTVSMVVTLVELKIQVPYDFNVTKFLRWKKRNPEKPWKDYAQPIFLSIYDSYDSALEIKEMLHAEAK